MPELPDLQVFSRNLDKHLSGKSLVKLTVANHKGLKSPERELKAALEGHKITDVYREGKELRVKFDNENVLGLHLMLHGKLYLFEENNNHKNTIIELLFKDNSGLVLTDQDSLAVTTLNPEKRDAPDALSKDTDIVFWKKKLKTRKLIKTLLLDQNIIRGIGNAYADEILWAAGISPFSISNKIPDDKIKILATSVGSVLTDAENKIRENHPDIINGEVRDFLDIHNSKKTHSPTGAVIHNELIGSRKTYYTDEQELYK